jgi:two-component system cell cycle response regulator
MKLLVADGSSLYRKTLKSVLEAWGYEVVLAADGDEAQRVLDSDDTPRLAIVGCLTPGPTGRELCELIRARKQGYVYTILLCATGQQGKLLNGFELGADDYLCKPFEELELRARLKVGERIISSRADSSEARETPKVCALHDPLLRIWNRTGIGNVLRTELSRAGRLQTPLSVLLVDLDSFKPVNDNYGQSVGDDVLRRVVERISSAVRDYDNIGRYGGDEFLVVLPNCTTEASREVAERVRQHIGDEPFIIAPLQVEVTASIGVSQWHAGQEICDLLHRADVVLRRAKQSGRNRVELENASDAGCADS